MLEISYLCLGYIILLTLTYRSYDLHQVLKIREDDLNKLSNTGNQKTYLLLFILVIILNL